MPTLTSTELLLDVIRAFAVRIPAARFLGHEFRTAGLKKDKTYTAHIAGLATVEDVTTTYAVTGTDARTLLTDVSITVDKRKGARLYWQNINMIADDKVQYARVIGGAGYKLAKAFIDDLLTEAKSSRFSRSTTLSVANSDADMLNTVTSDMNVYGAETEGRVMLVNSDVASTLGADDRLINANYAGQMVEGSGIRAWRNTHGFALIQEYPSLPSNNGTALTGVTVANSGDLFTKAAHGLETGDRVTAASFSAGFTDGTYFVIKASSSTFQLASSLANAIAGTAVAASADGTGGVITPTENLTAFATDLTGINFLAGPEDHSARQQLARQLGIPQVLGVDTVRDPDSGITMSAISYEDADTGDLTWMPVLLWGKKAGRQAGGNAAGSYTDYGGHLVRSA